MLRKRPGQSAEEVPEALGVERDIGAPEKVADAVFFGLGLLLTTGHGQPLIAGGGVVEVEAPGVQDAVEGDGSALAGQNIGAGIELAEQGGEFG